MKRMIIFALLISGPCVAFAADGVMRTGCPSGYIRIEESYHKLMNGVCVNGYRCLSFPVNTCLVDSPENVCYLFAESNVSYTEPDGSTYEFSLYCPASETTKCVKIPFAAQSGSAITPGTQNSVTNTFSWHGTAITMIGLCSSDTGAIGDMSAPYKEFGNNCWCKMIAPASMQELRWVYSYEYDTVDSCLKDCAIKCSETFKNQTLFRSNVISGSTLR